MAYVSYWRIHHGDTEDTEKKGIKASDSCDVDARFVRRVISLYHGRPARAWCFEISKPVNPRLSRRRHGRDARDTVTIFIP